MKAIMGNLPLLFALELFLSFSGCSSRPQEELSGERIYRIRCRTCHALPNPGDYTLEQWEKILVDMAERSGISHEERKKIFLFLQEKTGKGNAFKVPTDSGWKR
ncbi:MAG: c-type cytochrome [Bacteroidota bacterium]